MAVGLPISTYVQISTSIAAGGVLRTEFGTGLLVTTSAALSASGSGKVERFRDQDTLQAFFADYQDVVDDGAVWFSADPPPKSLYVGRWAPTNVPTVLRGNTPTTDISQLQISNGAFRAFGVDIITNLVGESTLTQIAAAIQTSLNSGRVSSVTVSAGGTNYGPDSVVVFTGGNPTRTAAATPVINAESVGWIEIGNAGAGYSSAPTLTIAAPASGTQATATATVDSGEINAITITNAGSGYDPDDPPEIVVTGGGGTTQATLRVVVNSGPVTGITITDGGAGYASVPTVTVTDADTSAPSYVTAATETAGTYTAVLGAPDPRLSGSTFTLDTDNRFVLTLAGGDRLSPTLDPPQSGTDIRGPLGFLAGGLLTLGSDSETVGEAVTAMMEVAVGGTPVALMLGSDAPQTYAGGTRDTRDELAAYAQAGDYVFGLLDTSDQALVTNDATSHVARAFGAQQSHVEPVYSSSGERPDIGLLALMSSQNLSLPASIITPHLKSLPGVLPTNITESQRAELERKRCNIYTTVGGLPSLVGGYTGRAGSWLDAVWWLLWLKSIMEQDIFNAQRASRRFNTAILADTIHSTMGVAVRSGGAMPGGRVNAGIRQDIRVTTGNYDFDGILPAGYLLWVEQPNVRTDVDRENRIGRFKCWVSPADAIHRVIGDIVLSG